jgi:single-strand DNA-binding protein
MASFAKIMVLGYLGRNPSEIKMTANGSASSDFSIAVSNKGRDGEVTTWYNVKVFGKAAEFVSKYLTKGSLVIVDGRHQIREYVDKEGNKRTSNEIFANTVDAVGPKAEAATSGGGATPGPVVDDSDLPF